jgi:ribonuclease Z
MKFCVLGTKAGGVPLVKKNCSATALLLPSETLLFDCGENTQVQLLRAGISRTSIHRIFLSHLHSDHVLGLVGLLSTMAGEGRSKRLHIYAPANEGHTIEEIIVLSCKLMGIALTFPIEFHLLGAPVIESLVETPHYTLSARMLEHRLTSYGFRVEEIPRINIDINKARALGLEPSAMLGIIKQQGRIQFDDGNGNNRVVTLAEIATPPRKPRSFVYCGDTRVCDAVVELARNADVMLHEATFGDELLDKAAERYHATASQAASQAKRANVGKLYLTHFSVRYTSLTQLSRQARKIFPNTAIARELGMESIDGKH